MAKAPRADDAAPPIQMVAQEYEAFVPFDQLTPHPANFNEGDIGLISTLLEENGFAGAVGTGPAILSTGLLRCPDGVERLVATIQHRMGELTVMLDWADADLWERTWHETHAEQSRVTTAAEIPGQAALPYGGNDHQPHGGGA